MLTKIYKKAPFLLLLFFGYPLFAQGDLMIMPKRIVFDGSQRSQEINLVNSGADSAVYAISFINYKMKEDGNFVEITEPEEGQRFAENFLRHFPRRVTLAPGEAQTIRVQVTRSGDLQSGEYRSHMYFRSIEEQEVLTTEENENEEGISINIETIFGISIPVIIREGKSNTQIELADIKLEKKEGKSILSMVIHRSGNMSVYGDLLVKYISPDGKETEIGALRGISVYTPNEKRIISFPVQISDEINLEKGKLEIVYSTEHTVFDQKIIDL